MAFLERVRIRNYKSIGQCEVRLWPLTLLAGRNAAGKSNFLDALSLVKDALETSLDQAIKERGGMSGIRRLSTGHPRNLSIELRLRVGIERVDFGFELSSEKGGAFSIKREWLLIEGPKDNARFERIGLEVSSPNFNSLPPALEDRLYLVTAASLPRFRPTFDALVSMGFYSFEPARMKELASPDAGELLHRDGGNIASVVARLKKEDLQSFRRVCDYLAKIAPGIVEVDREELGPKESLIFRQEIAGATSPWKFFAQNMSDGTLRVLGNLIAVAQRSDRRGVARLIGIEEPETALHPAAAGVLMSALRELDQTQVVLTTHSADLLDQVSIEDLENEHVGILTVQNTEGVTRVAPLDAASRESIRQHLFTAGELLRLDQLEPDADDLRRQVQLRLFE
jgi:predicted ATPase